MTTTMSPSPEQPSPPPCLPASSGEAISKISESFKSIQSHCHSVVSLSHQWRTFHGSFSTIHASLERRVSEVERKEVEVSLLKKRLESEEVLLKERFLEVEVREKRRAEVEVEERFEAVVVREKRVEDREKSVEVLEKEVAERCEAVVIEEERVWKRCLAADMREKLVEERFDVVDLREKRIEESFSEIMSKEREIEERCDVLKVREKAIEVEESRISEANSELERRVKAIESEESRINEEKSELAREKKEIEECRDVLKVREKAIEMEESRIYESSKLVKKDIFEGFRVKKECDEGRAGVESDRNRTCARCVEMERRERQLKEFSNRLEFKDKQIDWCLQQLELKETKISERLKALELREQKIQACRQGVELDGNGVCNKSNELEMKQKRIEGLFGELEVKQRAVNERCRALDLKEKEVEEHCLGEELREKEIDERCQELELQKGRINEERVKLEKRESEIGERLKELELKEIRVEKCSKELELKEKKISERFKKEEAGQEVINKQSQKLIFEENRLSRLRMELERRKRVVDDLCKVRELKDKEFSERLEKLQLKERELQERSLTFSKMKEQNIAYEEMQSKQQLVHDYTEQVRVIDKLISEQEQGLAVRERNIAERYQILDLKERQNCEFCEALKLKERQINERRLALEMEERECNKRREELKLMEKGDAGTCQTVGLKETNLSNSDVVVQEIEPRCLDLMVDDGETLQIRLNDRVDEHGFIDEEVTNALKSSNDPSNLVLSALNGFFPPHLRRGNVAFESRTVRSSCVLLLELLLNLNPEVSKDIKEKAKQVARQWSRRMQEEGDSCIVALGFLLLVAVFRLVRNFDRDELERLWEIVRQHRIAPQLRLKLDLFEEIEGSSIVSELDISNNLQLTDSIPTNDIKSSSDILLVCKSMNAYGLRLYLNQHVMEHKLFPQKVQEALKFSPDPAELVFKIIRSFCEPLSSTVDKTSCIFLLEQLMKLQKHQSSLNPIGTVDQLLSPPLQSKPDMLGKAKAFAYTWKHKLIREGYKPLEVYGYLQFLATYDLTSIYEEDELLRMLKVLYDGLPFYWPEQNPYLCRSLGLMKKIPDLIKSLVKEDRRLQAVKYICTFMEESHFPLAPILKDHVKFVQKRVERIQKMSNDNNAEKTKASFELSHLREVLQYIKNYKLELEFPPTALESRISELEARMADLKTAAIEAQKELVELPGIKMKKEGAKDNSPKRDASPSTLGSESAQQVKRLRVEASESPARQKSPLLPRQLIRPCSVNAAGKRETPAKRLELNRTDTNPAAPGAVYSIAVSPYINEGTGSLRKAGTCPGSPATPGYNVESQPHNTQMSPF